MSRLYNMSFHISGYQQEFAEDIKEAVAEYWDVEDWVEQENPKELVGGGDGSLCGGESEEEFTVRMAEEIWKANGGQFCEVNVDATYLEELPYESHRADEADFENWKKARGMKPKEEGS